MVSAWRNFLGDIFWEDFFGQASGALGETSDESDFSLLAWDSFSQEIRDLFTVVRSITYILLSKLFEFTWNAVIFFLKKKNCVISIEKREKQNKIWKISKKIEKSLRNDQRKFDYFQKNRKTESGTTEKSRPIRARQSW